MFYYYFLLFTGLLGYVVVLIMLSKYKTNQLFNIYLMLIVLLASTRFIIHATYYLELQTFIKSLKNSGLLIAPIPSYYLYFKNLVIDKPFNLLHDLKEYTSIIVFILLNHLFINYLHEPWSLVAGMGLFITFSSIFLYRTYQILAKNLWYTNVELISTAHTTLIKSWTIQMFTFGIFILLYVVASIFKEILTGSFDGESTHYFLGLCWLLILVRILLSQEILFGLPRLNFTLPLVEDKLKTPSDNNWVISPTRLLTERDENLSTVFINSINIFGNKIDHASFVDLVFRSNSFSLKDLSNHLNIPESHIVYFFKYHSNISFSEYRATCRIKDSMSMINQNYLDDHTIESLALYVGFASYSPFFTSFKKVNNCTPKVYLTNINNSNLKVEVSV